MAKQTVEIDVPDGYEIDEQVEIKTWSDIYTKPKKIRVKWRLKPVCESESVPYWDEWPMWLKCPYIAMDEDEKWFGYSSLPETNDNYWSAACDAKQLTGGFFDIKPPECSDWTQSLRKNPHIKD